MNKQVRGICCIINVFRSVGCADRKGTDVDRNRLQALFQQLQFRVEVFNDREGLSAEVSSFCGCFLSFVAWSSRSMCTVPNCISVLQHAADNSITLYQH